MKPSFLLILFPLLFSLSSYGQKQLQFQNISKEVQGELEKKFPEMNAGDLPQSIIDDMLRFIATKTGLENVRVEKSQNGVLSFIVEIKKTVGKVSITGNHSVSRTDLEEVLRIREGDRFDRRLAIQSGEAFKQVYGERGFFNTIIDISFIPLPSGEVNIDIEIKEQASCKIKKIDFFSVNQELQDRLNSQGKKYLGKNLTQSNLDGLVKDLRSFFSSRYYLTTSLREPKISYNESKTEAFIAIEIQDPFKWQFNVSGNKERNLAEIYSVLDLTNKERKNIDPVAESVDRLRRDYLQRGFPHVNVTSRVAKIEKNFINRVYLKITEGPKVSIEDFKIEGRISRPEKYYANFIKDHSSTLIDRGFYSRSDLDIGINNLITHLKNQGFLRARMQSLRVEFSKDLSKATVFINMDEGSLTQIRSITFDGNNFFSSRELISVFGLDTRSPLKLIELENGIEKLKTFYKKQGFMEMRILNENETLVSYNDKGTLAEVNFKVYEGPRIRVADIVIDGNTFTKDSVVLREASFEIGQILNPTIIEEATDRLNRLGIFSRVDVRTLEEGTSISDRTVIISVSEREPGTFRIGAGVNSERDLTARGFLGVGYNNLGGTGRAVSTRAELNYNVAQINYPEHELTLGYLEPFVFNTRTKGRVNLTKSERVFAYDEDKDGLTSITVSERADLLLERQFTKAFRGTWRLWSIDRRKDFEREGRCLEDIDGDDIIDSDQKCPSSIQQIGKIGPILDLDYRDSPFLPTRGSFSRALFEYSHPSLGSSQGIHFLKADTQYTKYLRLGSPRVVWANSLRGGYIKNLDGADGSGIPANQAFFLGGIFTVRGFDSANNRDRIPPESEVPVPRSTSIVITDYSYYGLFKSELRFPISGDHGGVIFYDGGLVQIEGEIGGEDVDITRPYRDAVGIGYRYNTPVGPVSLDFAFKIRPEDDEEAFRVHFSIGTF